MIYCIYCGLFLLGSYVKTMIDNYFISLFLCYLVKHLAAVTRLQLKGIESAILLLREFLSRLRRRVVPIVCAAPRERVALAVHQLILSKSILFKDLVIALVKLHFRYLDALKALLCPIHVG